MLSVYQSPTFVSPSTMIPRALIPLVFLLICQLPTHRCQSTLPPVTDTDTTKSAYLRLQEDLKNNPVVHGRIPPLVTDIINVNISVFPIDVVELDPVQQVMRMSAFIYIMWNEPALKWHPEDYAGINVTDLPPSQLWTPMLSVVNEVSDKMLYADEKTTLVVYSSGTVVLSMARTLQTSCTMDLTSFPFDQQVCPVNFYSLSQTPFMSVFPFMEAPLSVFQHYSAAGEWVLVDFEWDLERGLLERRIFRYTNLNVRVKRRYQFYAFSIIGPMGLVFFMNTLVFTLPPECGEKISFVISIFITNAVFSSYINSLVPRGFDAKVPLIVVGLLFMWLFSGAVFIATVVVLRKFHAEQKKICDRLNCQPLGREQTLTKVPSTVKDRATLPLENTSSSKEPNFKAGQLECKTNPSTRDLSFVKTSNNSRIFPASDNDTDRASANPRKAGESSGTARKPMTAENLDRIFFVASMTVAVMFNLFYVIYAYL